MNGMNYDLERDRKSDTMVPCHVKDCRARSYLRINTAYGSASVCHLHMVAWERNGRRKV